MASVNRHQQPSIVVSRVLLDWYVWSLSAFVFMFDVEAASITGVNRCVTTNLVWYDNVVSQSVHHWSRVLAQKVLHHLCGLSAPKFKRITYWSMRF